MVDLNIELKEKLDLLESWFRQTSGSLVAFSGGIDSTLVLYLSRKFLGRENAIGVISNSESLKSKDFLFAQSFCRDFDIQLFVIKTEELADPDYNSNPVNRCYFCKNHLFLNLQEIKKDYPGFEILSGTNYDDLGDYRPGIEAAKNNEVLSPLVDCKVSKKQIREIAQYFNLPNWNKPASPCLSSRIPYNQDVTKEKLLQIEAAEEFLNGYGFEDVRVRHFGTFGRIEVQTSDKEKLLLIAEEVIAGVKKLGFSQVEIDAEGLVSGKLNRVISTNQ